MNKYLLEEGFDVAQTDVVIDGLLRVMEGCIKDTKMGICFNWQDGFMFSVIDCYELVNQLSVGWPKHSGDESYPIPQRESSSDPLWEGEQLALRHDLMRHILRQLMEYRESLC
jgi:hypothetical protein